MSCLCYSLFSIHFHSGATQAIALAYDLIQVGRAERVVVIAGDNASSDNLMPWLGNGFRILGAATLCSAVSAAARPFHPQRSGMILGSGGIGMVLESEEGARRRHRVAQKTRSAAAALAKGLTNACGDSLAAAPSPEPFPRAAFKCRLLGTLLSNSAYHGAAMDREHIALEMERFIAGVEAEHGVTRGEIARNGVYFSHETGTHASPSSACAANEVISFINNALIWIIMCIGQQPLTHHDIWCFPCRSTGSGKSFGRSCSTS
jgi:3-oxoacyl-(acyl-carrier-protein) synthase